MKKILLTSILGLMTLVPNVSGAEEILDSALAQSYAPFKAALEEGLKKHSEIDKTKFLSMLKSIVDQTYHNDTGDTWLSTLVTPCVGAVSEDNTGKNNKYEICKNFITDVYEANNRIYNDLTNNLYKYFEQTATYMEPTGDIVARDTEGKYFVSTIKYPKNGLKDLTGTVKNQKAVFSTENQFVCLLGYENTCKNNPFTSTTAFVLTKRGDMTYLVEVNREQYDASFSGMGLSWDYIPAYVEAVKSFDFLDEYALDNATGAVDSLEIFAQGAVTSYKFEDQVQLCIDDIRQEHKERLAYSGVPFVTDDMINVKVNGHSCTLDSCSLTVEALGAMFDYNCVPRDKIPAAKK